LTNETQWATTHPPLLYPTLGILMSSAPLPMDWVRDARAKLKEADQDFHKVKPLIYWRDMIVSGVIAYASATVFAFFTGHHRDHHSQRVYGTPEDPEYVVNVCPRGSILNLVLYFMFVAVFPLIVFLRFLLAPLTFVTPGIREFTLRRLSAFTFNYKYQRSIGSIDRKTFAWLELACFVRALLIPLAVGLGIHPWTRMPLLYVLGATVVVLNQLRQLADHHFEGDGERLSVSEHIMDSCNYIGNWYNPVGGQSQSRCCVDKKSVVVLVLNQTVVSQPNNH